MKSRQGRLARRQVRSSGEESKTTDQLGDPQKARKFVNKNVTGVMDGSAGRIRVNAIEAACPALSDGTDVPLFLSSFPLVSRAPSFRLDSGHLTKCAVGEVHQCDC